MQNSVLIELKKIVVIAFLLILFSTVLLTSHTELKAEVKRSLKIRVVDVAGNPVSDVKVLLIHVTEEGYWIHVHEEMVSEEGTLEWMVPEGNYSAVLYCEGNNIESAPQRFGISEDTEVQIVAHLLSVKSPSVHGVLRLDGIYHVTIGMYDLVNVSVFVRNYYNVSKDVTIEVWMRDYQSIRVSEGFINTTIPEKTTTLNSINCSIALFPPTEGWSRGAYFLYARIYDEQLVYQEKCSFIVINDRMVGPFWMQSWFWIIVAGIILLAGIVYLRKKKTANPTASTSSMKDAPKNTRACY